jgi:hypothetical protein
MLPSGIDMLRELHTDLVVLCTNPFSEVFGALCCAEVCCDVLRCVLYVQVGPKVLLGWFGHFAMLAAYTVAYHALRPLKHFIRHYTFRRLLDALQYGSSSDYHYSTAPPVRADSSSKGAVAVDGSSGGSSSAVGSTQGVESRRKEVVANNIVPGPHAVPTPAVVQQQPQASPA